MVVPPGIINWQFPEAESLKTKNLITNVLLTEWNTVYAFSQKEHGGSEPHRGGRNYEDKDCKPRGCLNAENEAANAYFISII